VTPASTKALISRARLWPGGVFEVARHAVGASPVLNSGANEARAVPPFQQAPAAAAAAVQAQALALRRAASSAAGGFGSGHTPSGSSTAAASEAVPQPSAAPRGPATYIPRRQQQADAAVQLRLAVSSEAETIHRPIRGSGASSGVCVPSCCCRAAPHMHLHCCCIAALLQPLTAALPCAHSTPHRSLTLLCPPLPLLLLMMSCSHRPAPLPCPWAPSPTMAAAAARAAARRSTSGGWTACPPPATLSRTWINT
jgi:hypothetical protein